MKSNNSIIYFILAITVVATLYFMTRNNSLEQQLAQIEMERAEVTEKLVGYEQLVHIDSMLLTGEYDTAIQSYHASMAVEEENKMGIPLRIALAEKLMHDKVGPVISMNTSSQPEEVILSTNEETTVIDERKYDSLNFTLEKTKVCLARLKKQLRNKSYGEYLTFKSKKGNRMHYVGQVKNGKADGFGIALLDTGSRYEGQWKDNQRQGDGTFYWPDGEYYVGTYESDKRSGFGTYYWPNGEKYAGEWKEDKRSGIGKFFGTDGDIVADGHWNNDKLMDANKK